MSIIADKIGGILDNMFPRLLAPRITKEIYIHYKGQKLFFDFYVKEIGVYVEVQGRQHTEFVKHFHGNKEAFFNFNEKITKALVRKKISKVLEGECFYE